MLKNTFVFTKSKKKVKSVKGLVWLSVHPPPLGVKSDMSTS